MAAVSKANRMMNIYNFLVIVVVCVVVADYAEEEGARTHVSLGEFELDDQCYKRAESEWAVQTRSDLPNTAFQNKIQEEQAYGDKFRSLVEEVSPYLKQQWSGPKLNDKLHIFLSAGDILIDKEQFDKELFFSNSLQQIASEHACTKKPCHLDLQGVQHVLATSRDHDKLLQAWKQYQKRFNSKIEEYLDILQLTNVAAEANGAGDVETYWEQQSEFEEGYTQALFLWKNIEPLYQKLHAFVSKQLSRHDAFLRSTNSSLIPAHLLGSVAGNDWAYIADHVLYSKSYQRLLASMKRKVLGGMKVYKTAENMIVNLGLGALPAEFWEQSWFNSSCPAHVISYCESGKARVLTCNLTGWPEYLDAYESVMRIKHIQLAEKENSFIFRDNNHYSAIYEAVTGLSALLASSPWYLQQLGLLSSKQNQDGSAEYSEASLLLLVALRTLPKLPYYLAADLWRLEALSSNLTNITELSSSWRRHRKNMQLISVPTGDEDIFDFLSDPYITSNKPYLGKFFGIILQFQLLEKVLEGKDMDSNEMNVTYAFSANEDLRKLLYSGKSKNWADLLKEMMGIYYLDSGPLLLYFQKLESYLAELEQLKPVKPSRHVAKSTSTPPTSTVRILSKSPNDTNIPIITVNSTVSSVEENSVSSEPESKYGTGTIALVICAALAAVIVMVVIFVVGRRHFSKSHIYNQAATQES